jgi:hypothetical protein
LKTKVHFPRDKDVEESKKFLWLPVYAMVDDEKGNAYKLWLGRYKIRRVYHSATQFSAPYWVMVAVEVDGVWYPARGW